MGDMLLQERIETRILLLRGQKVMLAADLATLYGVTTKALNQAVARNIERFPEDFVFQLTWEERDEVIRRAHSLRSQTVTLKDRSLRGRHPKYLPYAFTEQGVAMLSSVLRSKRAVAVNVEIMRVFVRLRQIMSSTAALARRLDELERKYDGQFKIVFDAIRALMDKPDSTRGLDPARERIGFARRKALKQR